MFSFYAMESDFGACPKHGIRAGGFIKKNKVYITPRSFGLFMFMSA